MVAASPYASRSAAIDEWRGTCLNIFARGERATAKCLIEARERGREIKLRHLAGQRLDDLRQLADDVGGTAKQKNAFNHAYEQWKSSEEMRRFLAHGATQVSHDERGNWVALFDLLDIRSNVSTSARWAITQDEAQTFLAELENAFKALSGQIGHLRKRLA